MIKLPFAKNKTYYVVGLGKSNRAVIKALKQADADIRIWDDNEDNLNGFDDKMVRSPDKAPWSKIKAVIVAPGIPPHHPIVQMAREKDIDVICDVDLYCQSEPNTKLIGVTGTNGKSTVTALIHHILNADDSAQMGGNIGVPVMELKARPKYTVLELSSYQLDYSPNLSLDVAILLNITPDHTDWHGGMDDYTTAKEKIFNKANTKIISIDDDYSKAIFDRHDGSIPLSIFGENLPVQSGEFPRLRGQHNLQNILAAYHACHTLGIDHDTIIERVKSFEGLDHRQYLVRVINGIPYINDSKATNAEATKVALDSYRNVLWIAGGRAKDGGIDDMNDCLSNIQSAFLYGEAAEEFAEFLKSRSIETHVFTTMDAAVIEAHKMAQGLRGEPSGAPTVLLSPACASFDQFDNFEVRGEYFTNIVNGLTED